MKGRRVPPPIIVAPPRDDDPSQAVDAAFFAQHPGQREYERDLLPGEAPEPMPPGTRVIVRRHGRYQRWRAFQTPTLEGN